MGDATDLERLCAPVFGCLCAYWQLSGITNFVEKDKFLRDVTGCLEEAKQNAARDPKLEREYGWIEKPLVFFVDYMVKEGRFPFRQDWLELSRNYNELSGDEKFFDLLSETLESPDYRNSVALFYIMLGLGFDGVYRAKRGYIEQCMRLCMEKTALEYDVYSQPIAAHNPKKPFFKRRSRLNVRVALIACALFMAVCFVINLTAYVTTTKSYREILEKTAEDAVPPAEYVFRQEGNN